MLYEQGNEIINLISEQNIVLDKIRIALEALVEVKKSENFHRMYSKISSEDLAAR